MAFFWFLGILVINKEEFAKFFVIGYSMVLIFGILYLIPLNFGISNFSITLSHLKFGALFEMFVLSYAITYRVKKLEEQNKEIDDLKKKFKKLEKLLLEKE